MSDITTTLNACELVWRQQSIDSGAVEEMRAELESHLREATGHGKTVESVVGEDINLFARTWAHAKPTNRSLPADDHQTALTEVAERTRTRLLWSLGAIGIVTLLGLLLGPRGTAADLEPWQWTFVGLTFALLVGEILSGGFFVLPFGIGAASASALAFARVEPPVLMAVFAVVSALALWGLREFAHKDDDHVVPVGANRYIGQHAVVTEPINGIGTVGRVRIETESWMAIADNNEHIASGAVVTVSEVRGARLVVRT
ncbi:MAG: NfeD family protein [Actinomycetota bacterium]